MDKKQLNDSLASIKNSSADRIILPGNQGFLVIAKRCPIPSWESLVVWVPKISKNF